MEYSDHTDGCMTCAVANQNFLTAGFSELLSLKIQMAAAAAITPLAAKPAKALVLFGSETGNAEDQAGKLAKELKGKGVNTQCMAMDDYPFENITKEPLVIFVCSTAGRGRFPSNAADFWDQLGGKNKKLEAGSLAGVTYAVFGLGDTSYEHFCKAAQSLDKTFSELGATKVVETGLGDDSADGGFQAAYDKWVPQLYSALKL